ncbi:hypothetical protein [Tunturiibacter psychrotolerans]|uniref:hypothetical protein n=1 Tax=Tunturiibacter psychrotolerans TaxID=3069686 RepID=UPI003D1C4CDC
MSRALDPAMEAALAAGVIQPFFMAILSFKSSIQYVWTGYGNLVWNSQTYLGVGSFASVGTIAESTEIEATGISLTLSGIDPVLEGDSQNDMVPGAQANLYFGLLANGAIIGSPYMVFGGAMDKATIDMGPDTMSITIDIESRMIDFTRASNRRYTSADQRLYFPTDTAFDQVPALNDQALIWGS